MHIEACVVTPKDGNSVGVGVKITIGMSKGPSSTRKLCAEHSGRFDLKRASFVRRGGAHLGPVYLYNSIGVKAKLNVDMLQCIGAALQNIQGLGSWAPIGTAPQPS